MYLLQKKVELVIFMFIPTLQNWILEILLKEERGVYYIDYADLILKKMRNFVWRAQIWRQIGCTGTQKHINISIA